MCSILPYCERDGIPTLRDSDLLHLYDRMDAEGLAVKCYPDGRDHWLAEMKTKRSSLYVVILNDLVFGMLWLNDFRARYAHAHFVVFKDFHGRENACNAQDALNKVLHGKDFDGRYVFDGFLAMIPTWNRLAVAYARRCGFRSVGVIPFGYYDKVKQQSVPVELLEIQRRAENG